MKHSPLPNVRLVRCPRCSKVLPEPADVPVYRCGGCGTTLQAKRYKKADERRKAVSEDSGSVQNNEVKHCARDGEASSSGDQNEGINQINAQNDNLEQVGISNFSREASSSNQPKQQPPSSPDQHFPDLDEEREQNPEVTSALREDYRVNEPSAPSHEEPSKLVPETGEVQGDHRSLEQHGDCTVSSSNATMEQPARLAPGNGEVRQDEIIVEGQLEPADFSSEDSSSEATTIETEEKALSNELVDELSQNVSVNCRLEQVVASCSNEVQLSNEPSLYKTNSTSNVAVQEGKVEGSRTKVNEEQLGVSNFSNQPSLSNEPSLHMTNNSPQVAAHEGDVEGCSTKSNEEQLGISNFSNRPSLSNEPAVGENKSSSQLGSTNGEVVMRDQNIVADHREEQPGLGMKHENEFSSNKSSSQIGSPNGEVAMRDQNIVADHREEQPGLGMKHESEVSSTNEHVFIHERNDSSSQFLTSNHEGEADGVVEFFNRERFGVMDSNIVTSSNGSMFLQNRKLLQLMIESREMDDVTVKNEFGECEEDQIVDNLPREIISPAQVSSRKTDESALVIPETEKRASLDHSFKAEVSTAPDKNGNGESEQSFEADAPAHGDNMVPASPTVETVTEAEIVKLADKSLKTVKENPEEKMEEIKKTAPDGFETAASSKVTETAAINAHLQVGTSYRNLPKPPTRNSSAYDGSVSSYDGNDDQVMDQIASETMQRANEAENPVAEDKRQHFSVRSTTYSGSEFQRQTDNLEAVSGSESYHSAESRPFILNEIKTSDGLRRGPYRRSRMRPRTGEFLSRVPPYTRSPEMSYESSSHPTLVHEAVYGHPIHYPPYGYPDVESRVTKRYIYRSDVDGRMFPEMGEELPVHPYYIGSGEIYPYPRHQIYHQGERQARYHAIVHNMPQSPYLGETIRSGYRVRDLHSHLYPGDIRCFPYLPATGAYYSRGWYSPTEPLDSCSASPQVFTDSEYYAWSHDTISEEQRHRDQNISMLPLGRKSQPVQHIGPIGGAAPFITCYQCSELLQLPSDFLLFKGIRVHKVKCSACSSILKFALVKGSHLVPYTTEPMAPLSKDTKKHDYVAVHKKSASVYSGASQFRNAENMTLRSSSEASERQKSKAESKHSQDKGKSILVEMHSNATGGSSPGIHTCPKVTWEEPAGSCSPLHLLMGYSSPSAVLYGMAHRTPRHE